MTPWTRLVPCGFLLGCPWVSPSQHAANHELLTAPTDGDADTDADSDADADTDTDADADCLEDDLEPNDTLLQVVELTVPSLTEAALCPENVSPVFGYPVDLYRVDLGPLDVLDVSLDSAEIACSELDLGLFVTDEDGVVFPEAAVQGGCASLEVGWSADTYVVWISGELAAAGRDYRLDVASHTCVDQDGDGFLNQNCGGPDCSDLEPYRYPGAAEIPLDGEDQDCDGGDDLQTCDDVVLTSAKSASGELPCGDLATGAVWDHWQVPSPLPWPYYAQGLSVVVQNDVDGAADLLAVVVDADGTSHYGLDPSRSELDDEVACQTAAWTGETQACPGACVLNPTSGQPLDLWVAQHPGVGCADGAAYTLAVNADLSAVLPTLIDDDVRFDFP